MAFILSGKRVKIYSNKNLIMKGDFMKNYIFLLLCSLLFSGCMSIERSSTEFVTVGGVVVPGEQILISNYGYYLFGSIPLFTGSETGSGTSFFSDGATLDKTQKFLAKLADEENAAVVHIQPMVHSTCSFSAIPVIGSTLGLFWYREVQLSATIVDVSETNKFYRVNFKQDMENKEDK